MCENLVFKICCYLCFTENEFQNMYLGLYHNVTSNKVMQQAVITDVQIPPEFDWRQHNAVTPVKDQV